MSRILNSPTIWRGVKDKGAILWLDEVYNDEISTIDFFRIERST